MFSAHIVCSVGWLGAAAGYLALGVAAEVNMQPQIVPAAWIASRLGGDVLHPALGLLVLIVITVLNVSNTSARGGGLAQQKRRSDVPTRNRDGARRLCWGEACAGASRGRWLATQPGRRAPA